jgi:hypothetical protein
VSARHSRASRSGSTHPSRASLEKSPFGRVEAQRPVAPALLRLEQCVDLGDQRQGRVGAGEEGADASDRHLGDGFVIALRVVVHAADAFVEAADDVREVALRL